MEVSGFAFQRAEVSSMSELCYAARASAVLAVLRKPPSARAVRRALPPFFQTKIIMQETSDGIHLLETFSVVLDVVLVAVGFVMAYAATKIPNAGAIGKTVRNVVIGAIILGFAHLVETGLFVIFDVGGELNELIHRGIILVGFAFLFVGIQGLANSLNKLRPSSAGAGKR